MSMGYINVQSEELFLCVIGVRKLNRESFSVKDFSIDRATLPKCQTLNSSTA